MNDQLNLVDRLLNAKNSAGQSWIITEMLLQAYSTEIRESLFAVAVPHWFDEKIIAALLELGTTDAQERYNALRALTIAQPFGDLGYTLHDLTRHGILTHLAREKPNQLMSYSRKLLSVFVNESDFQQHSEKIYHLLIVAPVQGRSVLQYNTQLWLSRGNFALAENLLRNHRELIDLGWLKDEKPSEQQATETPTGHNPFYDNEQSQLHLNKTAESQLSFVYDVFVSYSSQDKFWVREELLPRLEAAGLKVCIDFRDFKIGVPNVAEIERVIMSSRQVLLIITRNYLNDIWTEIENLLYQTVDSKNQQRQVVPLRKENCELPITVRHLTCVDFMEPSEHNWAWQRLLVGLGVKLPSESVVQFSTGRQLFPSPAALRQLRTVLSSLYSDEHSVSRVADDVGLSITMIARGGTIVDYWHAVLKEALKRQKFKALIDIVNEEYNGNQELMAAIKGLLANVTQA